MLLHFQMIEVYRKAKLLQTRQHLTLTFRASRKNQFKYLRIIILILKNYIIIYFN